VKNNKEILLQITNNNKKREKLSNMVKQRLKKGKTFFTSLFCDSRNMGSGFQF